ncbi:hypothetical protein GLAREA_08032 [Glarea lozoyensis ATCC 20868]|uniref:Uncharacterized protein n=1 Tax=Glarea lozoyensis (strain ATCC 20868 / MF5171) TaxID=1116229 RepID=S3CC91_GLAL2|nr:uncharacterized protein GLAREA_08032 [Glarea lozoyensis ATCC 20868]EPE24182.1 hypothetical protein GLAREA_08032 [Glarea lozoyensis ATCC 20868]
MNGGMTNFRDFLCGPESQSSNQRRGADTSSDAQPATKDVLAEDPLTRKANGVIDGIGDSVSRSVHPTPTENIQARVPQQDGAQAPPKDILDLPAQATDALRDILKPAIPITGGLVNNVLNQVLAGLG